MSSVYVYALVGTALPPLVAEGERLESIGLEGVVAVVARTAVRPPLSESALQRQHRIVEQIAARAEAVLPARFGALVEIDELRRLVGARGDAIRTALDLVRCREQMTVRLASAGVSAPAEPAMEPASGTDYLRARIGMPAGAAIAVETIRAAVSDMVAAERVERGRGQVVATVYHLIAAGTARRYRHRIDEGGDLLHGFLVRVSGPWPPFAFAPEMLA